MTEERNASTSVRRLLKEPQFAPPEAASRYAACCRRVSQPGACVRWEAPALERQAITLTRDIALSRRFDAHCYPKSPQLLGIVR